MIAYDIKILLDRVAPLEQAGEWQSAMEICREAYRLSVADRNSESLNEAILRTGMCVRQVGDRELATEYLDLALVLAELRGDARRAGRALNGLGTLYHIHGELDRAEHYYKSAQEKAANAGDLLTAGHISQNLGGLAAIRGDLQSAESHYNLALNRHRETNHQRGIAGVLNNLGMLLIERRDFVEADVTLMEALRVAGGVGDVVTQGIVHLNRTELHISTGQLEEARKSCDEAFEIFSRLGEHANTANALRFYGIIYRHADKLYLAETHLRRAIDIAGNNHYPNEEAEAQLQLALVLRGQEKNQEALQCLNRAMSLFLSLQALHRQADIDLRISELESEFLSLVRAWGESIEAKDRYTRGHCQRVAEYACRIARHVGMSEADMPWFRMGAFLHDVGKTEIPGEILNKAGRLTDEERFLIEQHTIIGDTILAPIPFPWDIRPMVRSHHERWDGRGYPDQLAGPDIPLPARILHVADVFDALTTNRSYRQPLTADQAMQIMRDDYGSFDPDVFSTFESLLPDLLDLVPTQVQPVSVSNLE